MPQACADFLIRLLNVVMDRKTGGLWVLRCGVYVLLNKYNCSKKVSNLIDCEVCWIIEADDSGLLPASLAQLCTVPCSVT